MDHVNCFLLKVDDDITRTGCDSLYTLNNTQSNRVQLKVYTGSWWVYIHQEEPLLGHCWEKVVGIYRNAVSAILNGTDDDTFTAVLCIFVHKRRTLADRNTIYRKRTIYFHWKAFDGGQLSISLCTAYILYSIASHYIGNPQWIFSAVLHCGINGKCTNSSTIYTAFWIL